MGPCADPKRALDPARGVREGSEGADPVAGRCCRSSGFGVSPSHPEEMPLQACPLLPSLDCTQPYASTLCSFLLFLNKILWYISLFPFKKN